MSYEIKGGYVPYIQNGDWDLAKRPFTIHETIQGIFVDGISASETKQYQFMKNAITSKDWQGSRNCKTQEDLDKYFKTLGDIYHDYRNGRVLTQEELGQMNTSNNPGIYGNEVLLSIDREGTYMLESGGTHRLSIAKLVGVKKIPVMIIRKHLEYAKLHKDSC